MVLVKFFTNSDLEREIIKKRNWKTNWNKMRKNQKEKKVRKGKKSFNKYASKKITRN